jgi:hypothetical protein
MKVNEAAWDRILRVVVGIVFFFLGITGAASGAWMWVVYVLGVVLLLTGITGFCPLYSLFHISTHKA